MKELEGILLVGEGTITSGINRNLTTHVDEVQTRWCPGLTLKWHFVWNHRSKSSLDMQFCTWDLIICLKTHCTSSKLISPLVTQLASGFCCMANTFHAKPVTHAAAVASLSLEDLFGLIFLPGAGTADLAQIVATHTLKETSSWTFSSQGRLANLAFYYAGCSLCSIFCSKPFELAVEGYEGQPFFLHSGLVAGVSKPLERHINNAMREAEHGRVTLREVNRDTVARFCNWAYAGSYEAEDFSERLGNSSVPNEGQNSECNGIPDPLYYRHQ